MEGAEHVDLYLKNASFVNDFAELNSKIQRCRAQGR
jgi:hypothetical protein